MAGNVRLLDEQSSQILGLIAHGRTYRKIRDQLGCTNLDIRAAAALALEVCEPKRPSYSIEAIRAEHSRAYLPWLWDEDAELGRLMATGRSAKEIAAILDRQPSAIRSRIARLTCGAQPKTEHKVGSRLDRRSFPGRARRPATT